MTGRWPLRPGETMTTPALTDFDLHLLGEGTHYRVFDRLGARPEITVIHLT